MSNGRLTKEQFTEFCKHANVPEKLDIDILFNAYTYACDSALEMAKSNILGKDIPVNNYVILLYLLNEFTYALTTPEFSNDDKFISAIISIALDKYFTNEHLSYQNNQYTSKFSPEISTLELYLNLMLGVLTKFPKHNPKETLLVDIADKALKISKAISGLMVSGFETEAFSTWRTLHEAESILMIIAKYGDPVIQAYLKHMNYGIVFRVGGPDKETTDKVFEQIKSEMKALDLKSKDMKKFIEYGWLTSIKEFDIKGEHKLNFRDGVEKIAELSNYSKLYEMASEIAHSSPLLIYSKNKYYYHLTLLQLYESFFRIEKVFCSIYLPNISQKEKEQFLIMRKVYYPILIDIYEKEKNMFKLLNTKKASQ